MKFPRRWWPLVSLLFLVTVSHGLLDAMTDGGLGVAFFSPFDSTRYFFPWRPISVSPVGVGQFFRGQGAAILASEMRYVWLPLATVWAGVGVWRRSFARKSGAETDSSRGHDGRSKR
jgi:inner membrane protein